MFKLIISLIILFPSIAYAYLGPGVGGGIIAASIGILVAILAALFGILYYPIKRYIKNRKQKKTTHEQK